RTADALALGLGVSAARVRVLVADGRREAWSRTTTASPPPSPRDDAPILVELPVRHLSDLIGDVAVQPWPDRPLRTADRRLPADPRSALGACRAELDTCIDELRELARGVYPPVLAARGVGVALRARARSLPVHRTVSGSIRVVIEPPADNRRYGSSVEVAVYF